MTDAEKIALDWLDAAVTAEYGLSGYTAGDDNRHRALLHRMLAQPRLPAEPTPKITALMRDAWATCATDSWDGVYRALYAHLTKPKTKKVWEVRYMGEPCWGRYYTRAEAVSNVERRLQEGRLHVEILESEVPA